MNKRALIAVGLTLTGGIAYGESTPYMVKITKVDRVYQEVEAKFVVVPQDMRIVCHGEAMFNGVRLFPEDYVQLTWKDGVFYVKGTDMKCVEVRWVK